MPCPIQCYTFPLLQGRVMKGVVSPVNGGCALVGIARRDGTVQQGMTEPVRTGGRRGLTANISLVNARSASRQLFEWSPASIHDICPVWSSTYLQPTSLPVLCPNTSVAIGGHIRYRQAFRVSCPAPPLAGGWMEENVLRPL